MHRLAAAPGDRLKSALAVAAIHVVIGYALLRGLGVSIPPAIADAQQLIAVTLDPPPPPQTPAPPETEAREVARPKDAEGAASPANRKNSPTPVVAPVQEIRLPPSIPVALIAGQGSAAAAGAALVPGPGTGAGGIGTGLGSGRFGDGTGGGGGGRGTAARFLSGGIEPRDYPRRAAERRAQGTTYLRFTILPSGRVRDCVVTRSSGHRELDAATCPLLERSLRYRAARDASGRPVAETIRGQQDWELGPERPVREIESELIEEVEVVRRRRF